MTDWQRNRRARAAKGLRSLGFRGSSPELNQRCNPPPTLVTVRFNDCDGWCVKRCCRSAGGVVARTAQPVPGKGAATDLSTQDKPAAARRQTNTLRILLSPRVCSVSFPFRVCRRAPLSIRLVLSFWIVRPIRLPATASVSDVGHEATRMPATKNLRENDGSHYQQMS